MRQYKRFLVTVVFFALSIALLAYAGVPYDTVDWRPYMSGYVPPKPELSVLKWGLLEWPAEAERGVEFYLDVFYFNFGSVSASNVVLTDTLPLGMEFVSAEPQPSSQIDNQLVWELGTLEQLEFGEIKVKVRPTLTGTFTNTVNISTSDEEMGILPNSSAFPFQVVGILPPHITHPSPTWLGRSLIVEPQPRFEGLARAEATVILYDGPQYAYDWASSTFTPILTTTVGINRVFSGTVSVPLSDGDHYIYAKAISGTDESKIPWWAPLHLVVSSTLPIDPESLTVEVSGQTYTPGGLGGIVGGTPGEPVTITVEACCPPDGPESPTLLITETRQVEALPPLEPVQTTCNGGCCTYTFEFIPPSVGGTYDMQLSYTCEGDEVRVPIIVILIDPAGYVYDRDKAGQDYIWPEKPPDNYLIVNATVTCTVRTGDTAWEVWDASKYNQHNPQVTDDTTEDGVKELGYYAFFVPAGQYKIIATASGCVDYESPILTVIDEPIYHNVGMRCTQSVTGVRRKIYLPVVMKNYQ